MSCSTDNATKRALLERVPAEIKIHIIGYVADFKSLRNLMLSSRAFNETVKMNVGAIAKEMMANLIGLDLYKLALMAEVSGHIDITNRTEVKQFLDTYVCHEEWPANVYSIQLAVNMKKAHNDLRLAMISIGSEFSKFLWLTGTERSRLHRIVYICQIAGNLFRWNFGGDGEAYFQPPFPDLSQAFWKQVPAWDAARLEIIASDEFWSSALPSKLPLSLHPYFVHITTYVEETIPETDNWVAPKALLAKVGPRFQLWKVRCPSCGEVAGSVEYHTRSVSLFLSSGLAAMTGYKGSQLCKRIRAMYDYGCRGNSVDGVHDVDPMSMRVFYDTCHATIVEPLPQASPFHERDPGMKEMFCRIRRHLPTLDAVDALLAIGTPEDDFWIMAVADKTRLGTDISQMSPEQVRELWRQHQKQQYQSHYQSDEE
ncbi:hypothetical protein F5Y03DRAFT_377527 [Xylaria venustula]|nr:hypothetical protein F5Y03DRAFT_377527 [Xylaria venustula]